MIRLLFAAIVALPLCVGARAPARAQVAGHVIAVHASLTGQGAFAGKAYLAAVQFAVDEVNAAGQGPRFELQVHDDGSTAEGARKVAQEVVASDAELVLGPTLSPLASIACPIYGEAGLPVIISTVHADALTDNPTTFRIVISTGEIGQALAHYYARVLRGRSVAVLLKENSYGRPLAARFKAASAALGLDARFHGFSTAAERDAASRELASLPPETAIVLGMSFDDAVPAMVALRRGGYRGTLLGTTTMARASYNQLFAQEPEAQKNPGFFTDNTYATSPMILDSANAEILAFARRFETRFGAEPGWEGVQAYDGALLAMTALRNEAADPLLRAFPDARSLRAASLAAVKSSDAPTHAVAGVSGPIWFGPDRIRRQPVRIGRFHQGSFESAPLQIVPVADPDRGEIASGALFETEPGQYSRLQRVVKTGMYLNLIPRVDVAKSTFRADFYLWLRYARDAGPGAADPVDIGFPDMVSGRFNAANPAEATEMADGTEYRLWRVQGDFRNDFDLRQFPFDQQELQLRFFNARASLDRIVYVVDRRAGSSERREKPAASPGSSSIMRSGQAQTPLTQAQSGRSLVSPTAFAELTQWDPAGAQERRDLLVTKSPLGDLRRVGLETPRELSGFRETLRLQRRTASVLVKTLLPMLLMAIVMYCTLHFPHALTKEKVTVVVTAVLSGAVLLSSVNNQLGGIGYTIAAEYLFYVFFGLGLLCVLYVLLFETFRLAGNAALATWIEHVTRVVFLLVIAATITRAAITYASRGA